MAQYLLIFANTVGAMAVCTFLYGLAQRGIRMTALRRAAVGLVLGCGGIVVMAQPIILSPGFQADARGAFVGMAAAFGGPIAAGMAVILTVAARVVIGGNGVVAGALVIAVTAAGALLWRYQVGNSRKRTWAEWLSISLVCIAPSAITLLAVAGSMWMTSIFLSVVIALIVFVFGKMLETEQRRGQRERELKREASTDSLTALPNRRALEAYARELEREKATDVLFLLIDIDHFKKINDEYGHDAGDAVLREIGSAIRSTVRDSDFAARVGGEEFAVIVRTGSAEAGRLVAERFRKALRVPFGAGRQAHASIGGFFFEQEPFNFHQGYQRADQALYASKATGRDRVTFHQERKDELRLAS
ncbi:diguanylate cyclase [Paracoccus sp. Z118]|uniref:GGDEF domain-containing protein n=1 Tax=Paracoccus sp. Z118 TaxID=2851017 RepID=UPI001C2B8143|nr:diguanylate cyclase [Paracoccus sp. Z118]MBV0892859.1 diguanylate cyclase [Paracoccus sp. Z118]